ncbi:DnaJ domain-containing protein [bacterium]|nr:DnaJ domain-containing protein [bacterium]
MARSDYYKVLGLDEKANSEAIKKAYRRLAKEYHPDTHPGDKHAEAKFKEISEAYAVLGDAQKRQQYDQMRRFGFGDAGPSGMYNQGFSFDLGDIFKERTGDSTRRRRAGKRTAFNLDDLFEFGGFGDIFGQMFDRQNGFGQKASQGNKGTDIHANLEIPFEKAIRGGKTVFSINREITCPDCRGTGGQDGQQAETCSECNGSGMLSKSQGLFAVNRPCPRCIGKGRVIKKPCVTCQVNGVVKAKKKYSLNIKPGTGNRKKIRLGGQGNEGTQGTPAGDLIVTIKVPKHRFFRTDGLDVYCSVPLQKKRAEKGTKIRVKTVHGNTVELKVPAQTNGAKTFRLKGLGIKAPEGTGDQFVKVNVV